MEYPNLLCLTCMVSSDPPLPCMQALQLEAAIAAARPAQEGAAPPLPYASDPTVRSLQNSLAFGLHHWGELGSPLAKLANATWSVLNERLELVLPDVRSGDTSSSGIQKAETVADTYAAGGAGSCMRNTGSISTPICSIQSDQHAGLGTCILSCKGWVDPKVCM